MDDGINDRASLFWRTPPLGTIEMDAKCCVECGLWMGEAPVNTFFAFIRLDCWCAVFLCKRTLYLYVYNNNYSHVWRDDELCYLEMANFIHICHNCGGCCCCCVLQAYLLMLPTHMLCFYSRAVWLYCTYICQMVAENVDNPFDDIGFFIGGIAIYGATFTLPTKWK